MSDTYKYMSMQAAQSWDAEGDVGETSARQVEGVERHLGRGLADGLSGDEPRRLT